ncbi:toll-like receptor 5 [Nothobranchius furzeri]|uniref:Toll-like receptor 5 n=1 Tax=Nothobranchius furzeri TaxID=105023 RepID=A0A8C6KYA7_NOTFU|nr:toll-like receptor 5 [Nothobranchius furzeri]KAF7230868.1 toll-like receptor 5 [Nothobranchius furzeri]
MKMWTISLQTVTVCVFLLMAGRVHGRVRGRACVIQGQVAHCDMMTLKAIPPLPPDITHLYLGVNRFREINATTLSGLEQLQELDLGHQLVPLVIRNNAFSKQKHLRKLDLGFNSHLQLEPLAFAGLSSLQNLQLYHSSLNDSILADKYLDPLSSLQTLNLYGNKIKRLQPSTFFANMTNLTHLNLQLNQIDQICEPDLVGFKGKHFTDFNLQSVNLRDMLRSEFDWQKCGNPFRGISFETLDLSLNGLGLHQLKMFFKAIEGTKISHLKLSGHVGKGFSFSNLPDPDSTTFEGLRNSSVLSLDLSRNNIFALHPGVFSPLTEITAINLSHNPVNHIHKKAFQGLEGSLKMLNLSHNLLGEIHAYTFDSLTNLQVLDLSHNHIGILAFGAFHGLPNLKSLHLTDNSLQHLHRPATLPSLDRLMLNGNKLEGYSVNIVGQFAPNVAFLSLQNNRLTNLGIVDTLIKDLKNLQFLSYGGNSATCSWLSSGVAPNTVKDLDLHSIFLQSVWGQKKCLNLFDRFGNVTSLNLSSNGLQSLPQGVFKGLVSVERMDLSSNALTYIESDVLPVSLKLLNLSNNFIASPNPAAFSSLSFLDLSLNRFRCDADLISFLTWMENTNVTFLSPVSKFRCEFPRGLHNEVLVNYSVQVKKQLKLNKSGRNYINSQITGDPSCQQPL